MTILQLLQARDEEPILDTMDIQTTVINSRIMEGLSEETKKRFILEGRINRYIFFESQYFDTDRLREKPPVEIEIPDGPFECPKCHSKKVLTSQEQLRSGDEGATTIYHCQICKFSWKF